MKLLEALVELSAVECTFVRRLSRFTALVRVGGREEIAHLNNTGRLEGLLIPGARALCVPTRGPRAGLRVAVVEDAEGPAVIDTSLQERAFVEAVARGKIPWLPLQPTALKRNVRLGDSTYDLAITYGGSTIVVELKSAVMRVGDCAGYPDAPTERGARHLLGLAGLARSGYRAAAVFVAALPGVRAACVNGELDQGVAAAAEKALEAGVELRGVQLVYRDGRVLLGNPSLPVVLGCSRCASAVSRVT
ncbi:MAG: DNA/RNA nuclease SfsA [Desulfurococcaceae archaeon]